MYLSAIRTTLYLFILTFSSCALAYKGPIHWLVTNIDSLQGVKYPTAEEACSAGIAGKEKQTENNKYDYYHRVVGNFWVSGSYTWGNLGKSPSDPSFYFKGREIHCKHEYRRADRPWWSTFWPYSGATVFLVGQYCPQGQEWSSGAFGCIASPINLGGRQNNTCKPINLATGNKYFKEVDFSQNMPSPLEFIRHYNSLGSGESWTHSYQQSLIITPNKVTAIRPDAQRLTFESNDGGWTGHGLLRLVESSEGYRLTVGPGQKELYGSDGELLAIEYSNGISHQVRRDGYDIEVDRLGDTLRINRNYRGLPTSVVSPDGAIYKYSWTSSSGVKKLLTVKYPDPTSGSGSVLYKTYYYNNDFFPKNITEIKDSEGRLISKVSYDIGGLATSSSVDGEVERTEVEYLSAYSRRITNSLGKQMTIDYTQINGEYLPVRGEGHETALCQTSGKEYTYYPNGKLETKTDWKGNVTRFTYSDRGLEVTKVEAEGTAEERITTTDWHPELPLPVSIEAENQEITFTYDAKGLLLNKSVIPRSTP